MEWTKSYTLRLIDLWHSKPCLWQVKHPDFKSKAKRKEAVEEISAELGTSDVAIEKRLISLRTQYSRALLKCKGKSGDGDEDSGWYAFDKLHFIKDNTQETKPETLKPNTPHIIISASHNRKRNAPSIEITQSNSVKQIPPPVKKRFQLEQHREAPNSEVSADRSSAKSSKDKFSAFGELVAAELRTINEEKYIVMLKKRITDVIYDFKLDMLSNSNDDYDEIAFKDSPVTNPLYFPDIQHS